MTLILALANEEYVIQIADRRLSSNGKLLEDESNKSGYLLTDDSRMLFGFTGLAEYGTFKTRRWILDNLARSKSNQIREIFEEFSINATEYFNSNSTLKNIPRKHKRLSVMFTGFVGPWLIGNGIRDLENTKLPFIVSSYYKRGGAQYEDIDFGSEWSIARTGGFDFAFG